MFGLCEEIEIAQELENCKEIHAKWPHLVEAHLASLHEDIQGAVRHKWRAHLGAVEKTYDLASSMWAAQQQAHMQEYLELSRGVYGTPLGHSPFSLTGLHLGFGL